MKQHYTIISYILLVGILFLLGVMTEQVAAANAQQCSTDTAYGVSIQGDSVETGISAQSFSILTSGTLAGGSQ